jgi:hypothetical protein
MTRFIGILVMVLMYIGIPCLNLAAVVEWTLWDNTKGQALKSSARRTRMEDSLPIKHGSMFV